MLQHEFESDVILLTEQPRRPAVAVRHYSRLPGRRQYRKSSPNSNANASSNLQLYDTPATPWCSVRRCRVPDAHAAPVIASLRFGAAGASQRRLTLSGFAQQKVGVNSAVNTNANGTPPGGTTRRLVIGQEVVHNEDIKTDGNGQTQILFLDGSSVSVGPNADLLIDDFVYDPATGTGKMTLTAVRGAMRFVGGKLSKQDNAVTLHIGTATIGVRGGVFVADVQPDGKAEGHFVYGQAVTVSGQSGCSHLVYRSGFAVDVRRGGCPDSPHPAPPGATLAILSR